MMVMAYMQRFFRNVHTGKTFSLFALGVLLSVSAAQAKTSFTGTWKLNVEKSDFGPLPPPTSLVDKIDQSESALKINRAQSGQNGGSASDLGYTLDGQESTNTMRGNPAKSTAKWDGDALLIETKLKFQDNDVQINDRWTLGEDGKTILIARHLKFAQGEADQKLVMVKQ